MASDPIGIRQSALSRWLTADATIDALPARVRSIIADEDRNSERLIGYVQLAIAGLLWALFLIAPRPTDAAMSLSAPVPFALGIFTTFSVFRLWLIFRRKVPDWFVGISISADIGLVLGLIWAFHIQYGHPASLALKAPTFVYLFVLVVLRSLRFDPRYVLSAGIAAALGWTLLTIAVVAASGPAAITRSFTTYLLSDRILIGAEVEKIFVIALVTAILTIGVRRAQRTLVASLREQAALGEIRRFLPKGVAEQIAMSERLIEAGHAAERDAAILMLDIRGFTPLSMHVPPAKVVQILTSFHARIIPLVRSNGGVIDKFLGDGVMITFGAAEASPTPAADALRALEQILIEAEAWQLSLRGLGVQEPLLINGAATHGRVVFATLGDGDRLEYTVIGEAVNLAAKLEKHNKTAKSIALIASDTFFLATSQGYRPGINYDCQKSAQVAGVATALDLHAHSKTVHL